MTDTAEAKRLKKCAAALSTQIEQLSKRAAGGHPDRTQEDLPLLKICDALILMRADLREIATLLESRASDAPIDGLLYCPKCGDQHIDAPHGDWGNPPHKSHLCHRCGVIWRPFDVPTNGVAAIKTRGEHDTWTPEAAIRALAADAKA